MDILSKIFGKKYYAVIVRERITGECFINGKIYDNKKDVNDYKENLQCNLDYMYVKTIQFRR